MDQVLQVNGDFSRNFAAFGQKLNDELTSLGGVTVIDFSVTAQAGNYTAIVTYREGGLSVGAVAAHRPSPQENPSWLDVDASLQAFPNRFALFVRSIPPQDDRDLPGRQVIVLFSNGSPAVLPGGATPLYVGDSLDFIPPGEEAAVDLLNADGSTYGTIVAINAGTETFPAGQTGYVVMGGDGRWRILRGCC